MAGSRFIGGADSTVSVVHIVHSKAMEAQAARRVDAWLRSLLDDDGAIHDDALRPGSTASLGEGAAGGALFLHALDRAAGDRLVANTTPGADRLVALFPDAMAREGFPPRTGL